MKKNISIIFISILLFASCKKETTSGAVVNVPLPVTIATGNIVSGVHVSSGTVKIVRDAANKIFLVFENFSTDSGPDLRVWLSPNNNGSPYQEVSFLNAMSGNFKFELDASFNYSTNNHVLIWCKQFSVLFGYAVLQ